MNMSVKKAYSGVAFFVRSGVGLSENFPGTRYQSVPKNFFLAGTRYPSVPKIFSENFSNSNHDFFRQRGAKAESGTVTSLNLKDFLKSTLFGLLSQKSHSRKISTEFWNYALRGM